MTRTLIIGDSHVVALAQGYASSTRPADAQNGIQFGKLFPSPACLEPFFEASGGRVELLDQEARGVLGDLTGRPCFSAADRDLKFCISLGFTTTVLMSLDTWITHAPWRFNGGGQVQLMSDAVFRALTLHHFRHVLAFYQALRSLDLQCLAVAAPPPLIGGEWFSKGVDEQVLLLVDVMARQVVAAELRKLGVPCVSPPPESYVGQGPSGLRRPQFKGDGAKGFVHANAEYGRLMMDRVLDEIGRMAQPSPPRSASLARATCD